MINLEFIQERNYKTDAVVDVFVNKKLCKMKIVAVFKQPSNADFTNTIFSGWYELIDDKRTVIYRNTDLKEVKKFIFERLRLIDDVECKEIENE